MSVFNNEFQLDELELNESLLKQVREISNHPLAYAAYFQVATVVAAAGYAISKQTSLFRALEMLDEEVVIPYFFPLPDEYPVYEPTSVVQVPLASLMPDIPYGRGLLYFIGDCTTHLTIKYITQSEDVGSLNFETDGNECDNYDN